MGRISPRKEALTIRGKCRAALTDVVLLGGRQKVGCLVPHLTVRVGFEKEFSRVCQPINYEINSALHYAIPRRKALVGLEMYQHCTGQFHETILRPQVRIAVGNTLKVGLVMSMAVNGPATVSSFIRAIDELKNKSR